MESKLCPLCGAYWQCDCPKDVVGIRRAGLDKLAMPAEPGCEHDWSEAIGVDVDEALGLEEAQVMVCRLCGLYSVVEKSA